MFVRVLLLALPLLAVAQNNNCQDNPNFRWTNNWDGQTYNLRCDFLTNDTRKRNHCDRRVNGVRVRDRCRRSCDNCNGGPNPTPSWCEPRNSSWRDSRNNQCWWYNSRARCNDAWRFAVNGRDASDRCCSCQRNSFPPSPTPYYPPANPPSPSWCQGDTGPFRDSEGRQCRWYNSRQRCNDAYRFAVNGRNASGRCCSCQRNSFPPSPSGKGKGNRPSPTPPSYYPPSPPWGGCRTGGICNNWSNNQQCWNNCGGGGWGERCDDGRGQCCVCQNRNDVQSEK